MLVFRRKRAPPGPTQVLLGHTDPSFTLRTYVHLLDEGPGAGLEVPAAAPEPEAAAVAA
jgi:integrase